MIFSSVGACLHTRKIIVVNYNNSDMYYLYVLKSKDDGDLYIGSTNNLRRRFSDHNEGKVKSTMSRRPFILVYYEAYSNESAARKRELSLKRGGNALKQLKLRILDSLQ